MHFWKGRGRGILKRIFKKNRWHVLTSSRNKMVKEMEGTYGCRNTWAMTTFPRELDSLPILNKWSRGIAGDWRILYRRIVTFRKVIIRSTMSRSRWNRPPRTSIVAALCRHVSPLVASLMIEQRSSPGLFSTFSRRYGLTFGSVD